MKNNKLTTSAVAQNQWIISWFQNDLSLLEEKILHICNSKSQSSIFDDLNNNNLNKNNFLINDFINIYEIKGNITTQIKKAILKLKNKHLILFDKNLNKKTSLIIFDKLEYENGYIYFEFNEFYLNYILGNLGKGFFTTSSHELKNLTSKYSPKLLRILKSKVSLGNRMIIKIEWSILKKILLGDIKASIKLNPKTKKSYSYTTNKSYFNNKVLYHAINDINNYDSKKLIDLDNNLNSRKISKEEYEISKRKLRNSFISVNLTYQEEVRDTDGEIIDYIYHFDVTSSKQTLQLIDPTAIPKSTATMAALKNYLEGEIIKINFVENRSKIEKEKPLRITSKTRNELINDALNLGLVISEEITIDDLILKINEQKKKNKKLMDDIPIF